MDTNQKIHRVVNEDNVKFEEDKVIDFSIHNKLKEITKLES